MDVSKQKIKMIIPRQDRLFLIATLAWGFLAHGIVLTNKLCFHDDQYALFSLEGTYIYGRWMMGILGKIESMVFSGHFSTPLISGVFMLLCIAGTGIVILHLFELEDTFSCIVLSGVMVCLPVLTSLYAYMSYGGYYAMSPLFAAVGVYLIEKGAPKGLSIPRFLSCAAGIGCLIASTGIYQAYLPLACALMVLYYLKTVLEESPSFSKFLAGGVMHAALVLIAAEGYALCSKLILKVIGAQMTDYAGLDTIGTAAGFLEYPARIPLAYRQFFLPAKDTYYDMYPWTLRTWYYGMLLFAALAAVIAVVRAVKASGKSVTALEAGILITLFPLAVNLIFVLSAAESVHTLMMYPVICVPLALLVLLHAGKDEDSRSLLSAVKIAAVAVLMIMNLGYCRYDNICYLKAEFLHQQAISYFTVLAGRMQGTEGYRDGMPVLYLNPQSKNAATLSYDEEFDRIHIIPYADRTFINSYTWPDFMRRWCGYGPEYIAAPEGFEERPDVQAMPHYPDDGSIAIIDDILVVKF